MQTKGEIHHDRRLHQLMLLEASKKWARAVKGTRPVSSSSRSIKQEDKDVADHRQSSDSFARAASSPTDSVSSLHDSFVHDFR